MKSDGHILIVDDEATLRQTLARILQRAGFEVTTCPNGNEALNLLSQHTFDLVYLDIRMPDINGLEVLKTIHAQLPDLPVVLFTAQPDLNSAVEALRRGAIDYLLKPLKPQALIDRTNSILADKQKERRKRELQRQIEALQTELNALENEGQPQSEEWVQTNISDDRFLKRGPLTLDMHTSRDHERSRHQPAPHLLRLFARARAPYTKCGGLPDPRFRSTRLRNGSTRGAGADEVAYSSHPAGA